MAMRKIKNTHPVYRHKGREIDVPDAMLCLDCRTPVVWVEDDLTVSRVYHDPTCIEVRNGRGAVAPTRRRPEPIDHAWPTELDITNAERP